MSLSTVEFVNVALDHLGKDNIASLDEASTAARKAKARWERSIVSTLERAPWFTARKFANLASVTNDWTERWTYKYDLPNDMARFIRIVPEIDISNTEPQIPHQLRGGALYTHVSPCKVEYVFNKTSTVDLPSYILDAAAFMLARELAMPLTKKRSYWQDMNEAFEAQVAKSSEIDASQEPHSWAQDDNAYIVERGGGFTENNIWDD